MTKDKVIDAISMVNPFNMDDCTDIAEALVELGVVTDDGVNYHPAELLNEYPDSVKQFVAGMCLTNNDEVAQ